MAQRRLTPAAYRRITVVALAMLAIIVVTGALVRLTGSGLGCVDWPACNQDRFIDVSSTHGAIEQVNRLFTGIVALSVIVAVLGSLVRAPRRRDLTWLSLGLVAGVLAQVVIGGIVVLTGLHPLWNMAHFLVSMVLVSMAALLVRRAGEPDGGPRRRAVDQVTHRMTWGVAVLGTAAIVTGTVVTATGPHAGDENASRLGFELASVARVHGITVIATLSVAALLALRLWRADGGARTALRTPLETVIALGAIQGTVGYVQWFAGVPVGLVAIHIALATAIMVALVSLVASLSPVVVDHVAGDSRDASEAITDRASTTVR
jgi:heme a synthase